MTDVCTMCGDSGVDRWGQSCDCEAWMPMPPQPLSSDPKGPEPTPLTAEADEHEGHYAWEVEPFDPEGPVGIVISMADVECGQPLDATLVVLADSDDEREVEWARSTADDIAARLNEHQAQAATIAELQREIEGYRQALEKAKAEAVAWEGALEEWKEGSIRAQTELRTALRETRDQLQRDFAIRCRCDFVTKLPAGIERCVGCRARDRIDAIDLVLAVEESARD